nr:MAG TPA: hypothetical protein [Caudoviricetes sp.]
MILSVRRRVLSAFLVIYSIKNALQREFLM